MGDGQRRLHLRQTFEDGEAGEVGEIIHLQLRHEIHAVGLDGFRADIEMAGDFFDGKRPPGLTITHNS